MRGLWRMRSKHARGLDKGGGDIHHTMLTFSSLLTAMVAMVWASTRERDPRSPPICKAAARAQFCDANADEHDAENHDAFNQDVAVMSMQHGGSIKSLLLQARRCAEARSRREYNLLPVLVYASEQFPLFMQASNSYGDQKCCVSSHRLTVRKTICCQENLPPSFSQDRTLKLRSTTCTHDAIGPSHNHGQSHSHAGVGLGQHASWVPGQCWHSLYLSHHGTEVGQQLIARPQQAGSCADCASGIPSNQSNKGTSKLQQSTKTSGIWYGQ